EIPAAAAAAACLLAWFRSTRSPRPGGWIAAAGALASVAFLCRQNAGALLPILLAAEAWRSARGASTMPAALARGAVLAGAFLTLPAATVGLYAARGTLGPFAYCFYSYNRDIYVAATHVDTARVLRSPIEAARNFFSPIRTASVAALAGCCLT